MKVKNKLIFYNVITNWHALYNFDSIKCGRVLQTIYTKSILSAVSSMYCSVRSVFYVIYCRRFCTLYIVRSFLYVLYCLQFRLCSILQVDSLIFDIVRSFLSIIIISFFSVCLINSSNQLCKRPLTPLQPTLSKCCDFKNQKYWTTFFTSAWWNPIRKWLICWYDV